LYKPSFLWGLSHCIILALYWLEKKNLPRGRGIGEKRGCAWQCAARLQCWEESKVEKRWAEALDWSHLFSNKKIRFNQASVIHALVGQYPTLQQRFSLLQERRRGHPMLIALLQLIGKKSSQARKGQGT